MARESSTSFSFMSARLVPSRETLRSVASGVKSRELSESKRGEEQTA